ncbi:putative tRNA isopentenyltransferase [Rhizopus microsporus ATCC 52813]|uniref:tRNA dimethylallyltransferase n=3 Tax=Rhizopus microsporus TaxID=58291 RepID=A0A2G4SY49_RHIZD|nr:putative tRNA isopentenyltransferase [Rhizopus microsporus ATCC 52813]PHZ13675.1 putative tRNA isopentenyltransferase [Rhizopus microsporus ATCC 52813]
MRKIAAVIGSSGIGKSKLAVELCKALNGQVINADALQVYKGLDIITNKMPVNEREGIKHHLMDFLNPEEEYSVTEFLKDCSQKIESISEQSQLPVVVGGTNYYIQSLIWNNTLIGQRESSPALDDFPELDKLETSELYERLSKVDPVMANKWHPSDRRKILRSLKIYHQTGQPQSEIIKLQKEQNETEGLQPRYRSLIFWIYAEPSKLNPRLDERVDQMIETGLFDEIKDLRNRVIQGSIKAPGQNEEKYQRGLWQAIGYKEFDPYFNALEEGKEESEIVKIKDECTERMKAATRRYAKRQIQWIRNKLLPTVMNSKGDDVLVYLLDANDLSNWSVNVKDKAITVAKAFQEDLPLPSATSLSVTAEAMLTPSEDAQDTQSRVLNWKKYVCDICKTDKGEPLQLNGDKEWEQHKKSRFHRKYVKHLKVEAMRKAYLESKKQSS